MKTVNELTPEEFILPPLHQAARQRDARKLQEFLTEGCEVNGINDRDPETGEGGNSPLWFAAQGSDGNNIRVAEILLAAGADLNQPGEFNTTPMHLACSWGHAALVKFLCSYGARIDTLDAQGRTPKEIARQDYAEGLKLPSEQRPQGFEDWLDGMAQINAFFDQIEMASAASQ